MNVLLAGGTGVVGRPSIGILVRRGHRVFAMTRRGELQHELWAAGAIPVVQDVFDADGLTRKMKVIQPEAVIHQLSDLALLHDPSRLREAFERNTRLREAGTANLVAAMVAAGVEHIVAQSIAWFYRPGPEPYREEAPLDDHASGLRGISVEGVLALERSVLETDGVRGCVLRYGQLYGPGPAATMSPPRCLCMSRRPLGRQSSRSSSARLASTTSRIRIRTSTRTRSAASSAGTKAFAPEPMHASMECGHATHKEG